MIIVFGKNSKHGSGTLIGSLEVLRGKELSLEPIVRISHLTPRGHTKYNSHDMPPESFQENSFCQGNTLYCHSYHVMIGIFVGAELLVKKPDNARSNLQTHHVSGSTVGL